MNERQVNQAAFRQLNGFIQQTYSPGRFLAISGGKVIADAVDFEGLDVASERWEMTRPTSWWFKRVRTIPKM